MTDLVTWLRAQLDTDERAARAADVKQGDPDWWVSPVLITAGEHFTVRTRRDSRPIARVQRLDGDEDEPAGILDGAAAADHIALHDPARVLAEVEAKRRILDLHQRVDARDDWAGRGRPDWPEEPACYGCHADFQEEYYEPNANNCMVARLLALPYADRPGWLEEWRA